MSKAAELAKFIGTGTRSTHPAFSANVGSAQTISANTLTTIAFDTERFDLNSDYNTTTYKFIAPVQGKYFLSFYLRINNVDVDSQYIDARIRTTAHTYQAVYDPDKEASSDLSFITLNLAVLADMNATNEAYCTIYTTSVASTNVDTDASSGFFGYLVA